MSENNDKPYVLRVAELIYSKIDKIKLFSKDQINICSSIFLKILNYHLKKNLPNKKLYKYLLKLHSDYLIDVDESIKFNTLTNDLISIYFTRLNSNLIKYVK